MPKASSRETPVRYAPYLPLLHVKVNSQLTDKCDDALLREMVVKLGGTMVGIQHSVDYYVHDKGDGVAVDQLSDPLADFIGRHTNQYDQLIDRCTMFDRLNEMLSRTMPVDGRDMCDTILFRRVLYPMRAEHFTLLGDTMRNVEEGLEEAALFDIVLLNYKKNVRDPWATTEVERRQVVAKKEGKGYVCISGNGSLHACCHSDSGWSYSYVIDKFDTLADAMAKAKRDLPEGALEEGLKVTDQRGWFLEIVKLKQ